MRPLFRDERVTAQWLLSQPSADGVVTVDTGSLGVLATHDLVCACRALELTGLVEVTDQDLVVTVDVTRLRAVVDRAERLRLST
jgi:hypothetical protein